MVNFARVRPDGVEFLKNGGGATDLLPVAEVRPVLSDNERYGDFSVDVQPDQVVVTYEKEEIPVREINESEMLKGLKENHPALLAIRDAPNILVTGGNINQLRDSTNTAVQQLQNDIKTLSVVNARLMRLVAGRLDRRE